jgi:hypothetical protein
MRLFLVTDTPAFAQNLHMVAKLVVIAAIPLSFCSLASADLQYQSTSRITGGSLIQFMRFVPGTGSLKEPQVSTVVLQGNRLVRRSKRQGEIIDLDKRTITTINFDKRTYSEVTFEQMKQALEQATAKAQEQAAAKGKDGQGKDVNLNVDADVKDTGQTRTVNGYEAHEILLTMSMSASDPQSGNVGAMKVNANTWIAKDVPGAKEMHDFYTRMAKELDWAPTGMGGMMNRPDIAKAMAKMMAEGAKMDGVAVQQIMKVTMEGTGTEQGQQAQPAPARPSVGEALGGALGGKLGGLGGFGKRKKQDPEPVADASAPQTTTSGSLMEMTIDDTGFTTSGIDATQFDIPSGFKKVEQDLQEGRPRK